MVQPSLEEAMNGMLISAPDQEGPDAPEDEDRPVPPAAEESPDAPDADGSDGGDADGSDGDAGEPGSGSDDEPEAELPDESAPVAHAQVVGTRMNEALPITLAATDADDADLEYEVVGGPAHGHLEGLPPNVTYVPADSYVGFDSFSFSADSGRPQGTSAPAKVRIWVINEQDLSGQTVAGVLETPSDIEAWSFEGAAGQRVLITVNRSPLGLSELRLYPPGGDSAEDGTHYGRIDRQLQMSGQYTITVEDWGPQGPDGGGDYNLTLLNLSGQLASLADLDGGPILSGETLAGNLDFTSDIDAFTFEGTAGQRVLITVNRSPAGLSELRLYPPAGGGAEDSTHYGRIDRQLQITGQYTITVEDWGPYGRDGGGPYSITLQVL
jgi:hypothetical protein